MLLFRRDKCAILGNGREKAGHGKPGVLGGSGNLGKLAGMRRADQV